MAVINEAIATSWIPPDVHTRPQSFQTIELNQCCPSSSFEGHKDLQASSTLVILKRMPPASSVFVM